MNLKNEKGITLIALAITILVMIIIASISIRYGISSTKETKERIIKANLDSVQQALSNRFAIAQEENKTDYTDIGTSHADVESLEDGIKVLLLDDNYDNYYILNQDGFDKLGLNIKSENQEYLVNFKTGEVFDLTNKKYESNGEYIYTNALGYVLDFDDNDKEQESPITIELGGGFYQTTGGQGFYELEIIVKDSRNALITGGTISNTENFLDSSDFYIRTRNDNTNIPIRSINISRSSGSGFTGNTHSYTISIDKSNIGYNQEILLTVKKNSIKEIQTVEFTDIFGNDEVTLYPTFDTISDADDDPSFTFVTIDGAQQSPYKILYEDKNYYDNGERIVEYIQPNNWGTSAVAKIKLYSTNSYGIKAGKYEFSYRWNMDDPKSLTIKVEEGQKEAYGTIFLTEGSGRGTLLVNKLFGSRGSSSIDDVGLDNTPPSVIINGSGSKYINKQELTYSRLPVTIGDEHSGLRYAALTSSSFKVGLTQTSTPSYAQISSGVNITRNSNGTINLPTVKDLWGSDFTSGKYYYWIRNNTPGSSNTIRDNVGNESSDVTKELIIDPIAPQISLSIDNDELIGYVKLTDDYSGIDLTTLSSIQYTWSQDRPLSDSPRDWAIYDSCTWHDFDLTEIETNVPQGPLELTLTADQIPTGQSGSYYLIIRPKASTEGVKDVAGNPLDMVRGKISDQTLDFTNELKIIVSEEEFENGVAASLGITVKSKEDRKFALSKIELEYIGLPERKILKEGISNDGYTTTEYDLTQIVTTNGPIIIHAIDNNGNDYSEMYIENSSGEEEYIENFMVTQVQETQLVYNISDCDKMLMLPICDKPASGKILLFVDWGDGNQEYITNPAVDRMENRAVPNPTEEGNPELLNYLKLNKNVDNSPLHKYETNRLYTVKISGSLYIDASSTCWNYMWCEEQDETYGNRCDGTVSSSSNMINKWRLYVNGTTNFSTTEKQKVNETITEIESLMTNSKNSLEKVQQFGMHNYDSHSHYKMARGWSMESFYGCCPNLYDLSASDKSKRAFQKVTSFKNTFKGNLSLRTINQYLFEQATMVESFESTFAFCENFNFEGGHHGESLSGYFSNCTECKNFSKTFRKTAVSAPSADLFKNNTKAENFSYTFYDCSNLNTIPYNLFFENIEAFNFSYTFGKCTNIKNVDVRLFSKNIQAKNFSRNI